MWVARYRYFRIEEDPKAKVSSNFMTNFLQVRQYWSASGPVIGLC